MTPFSDQLNARSLISRFQVVHITLELVSPAEGWHALGQLEPESKSLAACVPLGSAPRRRPCHRLEACKAAQVESPEGNSTLQSKALLCCKTPNETFKTCQSKRGWGVSDSGWL